MSLKAQPAARRTFLRFVGTAPLALAGGGAVLSGCTEGSEPHASDQAHVARPEEERYWRALREMSAAAYATSVPFPPALEAMANTELTLTGFIRRTPGYGRLIFTQRAVGCPSCDRQKLWPVIEVIPATAFVDPLNGPVRLSGTVELRRFGDGLPVALKRATVVQA
jgi:hypothetical protein